MSKKVQTPTDNDVEGVVLIDPTTGLAYAGDGSRKVYVLLDAVTTNQTSSDQSLPSGRRTIHTFITGTGAVSATLTWYGKNRTSDPGEIIAISTLSGTTTDSTGKDVPAEWPIMYAILTAITGTGATVTATVSV